MNTEKLICNSNNVTYDKGYIALWVELAELPSTLTFRSDVYNAKSAFHVSLLCTKRMLTLNKETESKILNLFCDFLESNDLSFQGMTNELRLVVDEVRGRKSIIAMCRVNNLDVFISQINAEFSLTISLYPTHITLYTLGENMGIGIDSKGELQMKSVIVEIPELLEISKGLK